MPAYTVTFLNADGTMSHRRRVHGETDDHVIELVGEIEHPYAIDIHHRGRHVARFPPWLRRLI